MPIGYQSTIMKDTIKELIELVDNLEKNVESNNKEQVLELLSKLKRAQDDPANEEHDDEYEDLIFRVIYIIGQL